MKASDHFDKNAPGIPDYLPLTAPIVSSFVPRVPVMTFDFWFMLEILRQSAVIMDDFLSNKDFKK